MDKEKLLIHAIIQALRGMDIIGLFDDEKDQQFMVELLDEFNTYPNRFTNKEAIDGYIKLLKGNFHMLKRKKEILKELELIQKGYQDMGNINVMIADGVVDE